MSTLKTGALRGTSGTADSIQLHASNQSVTFPGAVTVSGGLTGAGNVKCTTVNSGDISSSGVDNYAFESLPTGIYKFELIHSAVSWTSNGADYGLKFGTGSTTYADSSNFYRASNAWVEGTSGNSNRANNADAAGTWVFNEDWGDAANPWYGVTKGYKDINNVWTCIHQMNRKSEGAIVWGNCRFDLGAALSAIKIVASNNFDQGMFILNYYQKV